MAHSPSLPFRENGELSSPDPLNSSQQTHDYRCATRSPSPAKRAFSSPTKRQRIGPAANATPPRTSHSQRVNGLSPSKTVTEQTLSPWRIRVTVETEPEDMNLDAARSASRTVMIPLRDASSPTEERTRTSRGRGSQPGTAKSKRSATPVRNKSRSRSRRQSVTDLNIIVLGDEGDSNDWTRQKSPRKKRATSAKKSQPVMSQTEVVDKQDSLGRTRRRTPKSAPRIEIREDTDAEEDVAVGAEVDLDSPELRSIDLNRVSVRPRSVSAKQQPADFDNQSMDPSEEGVDHGKDKLEHNVKRASMVSASYPTPDPSVQGDQEVNEPPAELLDDHEGFDTILESEGFTMIDLQSLPSARHFLSSPLEIQHGEKPSEPDTNPHNHISPIEQSCRPAEASALLRNKSLPSAIPSYLTLPEGESDISSNVPSSPPVPSQAPQHAQPSSRHVIAREITPDIYSSPKLPSPPQASQSNKGKNAPRLHKSTPPTLAKVVKAGIALQGVLSPKSTSITERESSGTPEERLNNLFEGFDSGTRRELRAGLRFGEELARRQRSSPTVSSPSDIKNCREMAARSVKVSTKQTAPATQVWRGEAVVQRTPPQILATNDKLHGVVEKPFSSHADLTEQSLPKSSLRNEISAINSAPQKSHFPAESQSLIDSEQQRERQYQREREAVSKEIENASSSQVVVIESENEDENISNINPGPIDIINTADQDEIDIWCEEAASCDQRSSKSSARPFRDTRASRLLESKQKMYQHDAQEGKKKPRRSFIPSPWRRSAGSVADNSCLTTGDMTGLFYHEPREKIKFGAAEIERQKRHSSGDSLDMSGTRRKEYSIQSIASGTVESFNSDAKQLHTELNKSPIQFNDSVDNSQTSPQAFSTEEASVEESRSESVGTNSQCMEDSTQLSLPPQPIKIPVNFNDSTVSCVAPCLTGSSSSTDHESSRPSTPRSALKGARLSLGLEDANSPAVRKVVFSSHETRVDLDGLEEQLSMQSVSSSPEEAQNVEEEQEELSAEADVPQQSSGLLGWLWGGSTKIQSSNPPSIDGSNDTAPSGQKTPKPKTSKPAGGSNAAPTRTPSYLLPPSYPSDPTRDVAVPLSTSGDFTNTHFRTLHIIYAKSLRPRFHAPRAHEVRPRLRALLNAAFEADESQSGLGVFEWQVDEMGLRVVERFLREVEWGYTAGGSNGGREEVKWGWTEREICERLFRVIVGDEVRREENRKLKEAALGS